MKTLILNMACLLSLLVSYAQAVEVVAKDPVVINPDTIINRVIDFSLVGARGNTAMGDSVLNGGGLAERNFAQAYINLQKYISYCLQVKSCQINTEEKLILEKILDSLPQENATKKQLKLLSGKKHPEYFLINGELKIASTGNDVGSPIYINTDLITTVNNITKNVEALTIFHAVSILIHEMGHHHQIINHTKLDLLGIKVSMVVQQQTQTSSLLPNSDVLQLITINGNTKQDFPEVYINIFGGIIDVSKALKDSLKCKIAGIPLPINLPDDLAISFSKPSGATFHNVYWSKNKINIKKGKGSLRVTGNLVKYCKKMNNLFVNNRKYKATIAFKIESFLDDNNNLKWRYKKDSIKIKEYYDTWWKIFKIPGF